MIVNRNSHKENDVVVLKIATGEFVLAKYIREEGGMTCLMRPFSLMQTEKGLNLIDFVYGADKTAEVKVAKEAIIAITKAMPELANEYNQMTTDLIVPPKPKFIS